MLKLLVNQQRDDVPPIQQQKHHPGQDHNQAKLYGCYFSLAIYQYKYSNTRINDKLQKIICTEMLYFIRHGQSQFNLLADIKLREKLGNNFSKQQPEYLALKFDQKFIDCGLTEVGKEQCMKAREYMKSIPVDLVIVSPMRRALMTCDLIFQGHPSKPKVIVDPDIREVFSSSCDIGGRIYESMEEMPHFDYSKIKNPSHWYIDSIKNVEIKQSLLKQIAHIEQEHQRAEQAKKIKLKYLIDEISSITPHTFADFEAQKNKFKQISKEYKSVAIVSHSENILNYTGKEPANCEVVEVEAEKL